MLYIDIINYIYIYIYIYICVHRRIILLNYKMKLTAIMFLFLHGSERQTQS